MIVQIGPARVGWWFFRRAVPRRREPVPYIRPIPSRAERVHAELWALLDDDLDRWADVQRRWWAE